MNDTDKRYSNTNEVYKPIDKKDGRIKNFIKLLNKKGFIVQKGRLKYIDILKLVNKKCLMGLCIPKTHPQKGHFFLGLSENILGKSNSASVLYEFIGHNILNNQ